MENLLEVRDIHTFIGQYHILQGVSINVPKGQITALLGRNGAGKTTTLKSILGLTPPNQGKIIFNNQEIQRKGGKTVMLVEHNMNVVMSVSDTITVMHLGKVLAEGKPSEITTNQAVQSAYLGGLYGDLSKLVS